MNAIKRRAPIVVGSTTVAAGRRQSIEIPIARLVTGSMLSLPVVIVHGLQPGPIMWMSAALHGDEIAGVEIIRRVLAHVEARDLSGTLLAVSTVNVFGLVNGDRYLPDRRDLNRAFPGSARGRWPLVLPTSS